MNLRRGVIAAVIAIPLVIVGAFGLYLAGLAGELPWQVDPTRIPQTPFAGIPGLDPASTTGSTGDAAVLPPDGRSASIAAMTDASDAPTPTPAPSRAAITFDVVADRSEARYVAREQLAGRDAPNDAVGTTNAIIGRIGLNSNGVPVAGSGIDVDLHTLVSDNARRDNYLRRNTLDTETYPLATFVVTGIEGWAGPLVEGQAAAFRLLGDLTVRGVTKPVVWDATATLRGDTLEGTATTTIAMPDFDITPPKVGPVLSLAEEVRLELAITATRSS